MARRIPGFSLVEMLVVIAIIAILASLLLPAIQQGKARAMRLQCVSQLHQVGVAFQNFAHDHEGRFPMAVPGSAGGSQEFTVASYQITGEFFFSFRHFQALSNELTTPKILVCPADSRQPAATFISFNNRNLSYFVGLNADFSRPYSILAGDRNVTNDLPSIPSLVRPGLSQGWRWSGELHQFKGNLLFADAHVEETTTPSLGTSLAAVTIPNELAFPNVPAQAPPNLPGSNPAGRLPPTVPTLVLPPRATPPATQLQEQASVAALPVTVGSPLASIQTTPPDTQSRSNATPAPKPSTVPTTPAQKPGPVEEPGFSFFPGWAEQGLKELFELLPWLIGLLLALVLARTYLARRRPRSQATLPANREVGNEDLS